MIVPSKIEQILDAALIDGVVPREDAIALNEWMNDRVREQPRRLIVELREFTVDSPSEALARIARGEEIRETERNMVLAWIAQLRDDEIPNDVRTVLVHICVGDSSNVTSQRTVAKWLLSGTGRNEIRGSVRNFDRTVSPSFPSPYSFDSDAQAAPKAETAPPPPVEAPAPAPSA